MEKNKQNQLGSGVASILGARPVISSPAVSPKKEDDYYVYRRGRPRKDAERPSFTDGKVFENTSLRLERDQYANVREYAQKNRMTISEAMYRLLEVGLEQLGTEKKR